MSSYLRDRQHDKIVPMFTTLDVKCLRVNVLLFRSSPDSDLGKEAQAVLIFTAARAVCKTWQTSLEKTILWFNIRHSPRDEHTVIPKDRGFSRTAQATGKGRNEEHCRLETISTLVGEEMLECARWNPGRVTRA